MTAAEYVDTHYSRTLADDRRRPPLDGTVEAEVCVVGGGMAGLATALGLAERGRSVVLLEARRVGWGASGRNGGFVSAGFSRPPRRLIAKVGLDHARRLYELSKEAVALVRRRIADHRIPCGDGQDGAPIAGIVRASWFDDPDEVRRAADFLNESFALGIEVWPRERVRELYRTSRYHEALFNPSGFQIHSLNFTRGIAAAAESRGVRIFEETPATALDERRAPKLVQTPDGLVRADHVVLCCSGYIGGLYPKVGLATLPIGTYVMLTEPLGDRLASAIRAPYGVGDTRFAADYYRPLKDGRILWGGRISARTDPRGLAKTMLGDLLRVYPQLEGTKVDAAWPGTMGYAVHKMPTIGQSAPGLWHCTTFGGHGMATTTMGGELVASAIAEGDERWRLFEPFGLAFAGGPLGPWVAQATYWWWQMRDALRR